MSTQPQAPARGPYIYAHRHARPLYFNPLLAWWTPPRAPPNMPHGPCRPVSPKPPPFVNPSVLGPTTARRPKGTAPLGQRPRKPWPRPVAAVAHDFPAPRKVPVDRGWKQPDRLFRQTCRPLTSPILPLRKLGITRDKPCGQCWGPQPPVPTGYTHALFPHIFSPQSPAPWGGPQRPLGKQTLPSASLDLPSLPPRNLTCPASL